VPEPAQIQRSQGFVAAQFSVAFDHPAEQVWRHLTDPALLPQWMAPGEVGQALGAPVHLDFGDSGVVVDSVVTAFEPGRLIQYAWSAQGDPERPLTWRVEPNGEGRSRLELVVRIPEGEDAARGFAGWDAHLEMLAAALENVAVKFPFEHFKERRAHYAAQLQGAQAAPAG
jgi:uncharacterized protein YndB with AHSA1/START domain